MSRWFCHYRGIPGEWESDNDMSQWTTNVVCELREEATTNPLDLDASQLNAIKDLGLKPIGPQADDPNPSVVPPTLARNNDGTLVQEGQPYSQGGAASLWRFPTRFLPDSVAKQPWAVWLALLLPFGFWGALLWFGWKAVKRR